MLKIFHKVSSLIKGSVDPLEEYAQKSYGVSAQELRHSFRRAASQCIDIIILNGGSLKICMNYIKLAKDNGRFKEWGIMLDKDSPYSQEILLMSSLDLLIYSKKLQDKNQLEYLQSLSKSVYISSSLIFSLDEIKELHKDSGGREGEITMDPLKSLEIARNMRSALSRKVELSESRWLWFRNNGFDFFEGFNSTHKRDEITFG